MRKELAVAILLFCGILISVSLLNCLIFMKEQTSIPKHKITRAAKLMGSGAKIGASYVKYAAKKTLTGNADKSNFHETTAKESYKTFSNMKGAPLKLAQMLSMDNNLIPEQYVSEYSQAQYSAPPLSYPLVVKTFLEEMKKKPKELFDDFSQHAVAGASIGQVHKATLGGTDYAVKVQYPGVAQSLHSDLAIVKPMAMKLFNIDAKSIEPFMEEVKSRLLEETDYILERSTSETLIAQSRHLPHTHFPTYRADLSSKRILTMSWIEGEPLDQFAEREQSQELRNKIGQALWDFYEHQIHALNVFHADPHPGNFLIKDNELYVLDFGCVKKLPVDFYRDYFQFMDKEVVENPKAFSDLLYHFGLLLPSDTPQDVKILTKLLHDSIALLSRPFEQEVFDFGNESYFEELAAFGEQTREDKHLKKLNQIRGSADALYLNRTYFGVYNICGMLGAQVQTQNRGKLNELGVEN